MTFQCLKNTIETSVYILRIEYYILDNCVFFCLMIEFSTIITHYNKLKKLKTIRNTSVFENVIKYE